jgi:hypothetical protein
MVLGSSVKGCSGLLQAAPGGHAAAPLPAAAAVQVTPASSRRAPCRVPHRAPRRAPRRVPVEYSVEYPSSTPECPCSVVAARLRMGRCGAGGRAARGSGYWPLGSAGAPNGTNRGARGTPSTRERSQAHAAPARMMESDAAISLLATTRCAQYRRVPVEHVYSTPSREYPLVPSRVPPKLPPHSVRESSWSAPMRPSRPRRVAVPREYSHERRWVQCVRSWCSRLAAAQVGVLTSTLEHPQSRRGKHSRVPASCAGGRRSCQSGTAVTSSCRSVRVPRVVTVWVPSEYPLPRVPSAGAAVPYQSAVNAYA